MKKLLLLSCLLCMTFVNSALATVDNISWHREVGLTLLNHNIVPREHSWPYPFLNIGAFGNFDITPKTMQKTLAGEEEDYFALSNVGVNIDAKWRNLLSAHVGIAYFETNKGQGDRFRNTGGMLDDAYMVLANFAKYPFFLEGGRFYLPFGYYNRYSIVPSLAEVLAITREAGVQTGFINWHGLSGAVYVSQGQLRKKAVAIQGYLNGGATVNFEHRFPHNFCFGASADYIYNLLQSNALSESDAYTAAYRNFIYSKPMGGVALHGHIGYRWLTIFGQYVTALTKSNDLIRYFQTPTSRTNPVYGARPSAWDAGAMVKFKTWHWQSKADFTYSRSSQMAGLYIFNSTRNHMVPRSRYIIGYTVYFTHYILMRLQWAHDYLYKEGKGDTGRQGDDATIRFGFKW